MIDRYFKGISYCPENIRSDGIANGCSLIDKQGEVIVFFLIPLMRCKSFFKNMLMFFESYAYILEKLLQWFSKSITIFFEKNKRV